MKKVISIFSLISVMGLFLFIVIGSCISKKNYENKHIEVYDVDTKKLVFERTFLNSHIYTNSSNHSANFAVESENKPGEYYFTFSRENAYIEEKDEK